MEISLDMLGEDAKMNSYWKRLWTEISLDNLIYNFNTLKSSLPTDTAICCVVKANAYGHHAPRIAKVLEREGADCFAVSNIEEALQLRSEGIVAPILMLGYTPTDCAAVLAKNNITQCVYSYDYATELAEYAKKADSIDTNPIIALGYKLYRTFNMIKNNDGSQADTKQLDTVA